MKEWGYGEDNGPEQWAKLSADYALCCEGRAQSPINLSGAAVTRLTPIEFHYAAAPLAIFNSGRTIQVNYAEGSYIVYNGKIYNLLQFHFHKPGEHTIDGQGFAMELHLVHSHPATGNLAAVAVMIEAGDATNAAYRPVFDNLPTAVGAPDEKTARMFNAADLLPEDTSAYFTYEGSLTFPPCSENVRWLVLATPVRLSTAQIAAFGAICAGNTRPLQPLNNRDLFTNRG